MRVFMTGASGLIGALLTRKLVERGDEVTALSRSERPPQKGVTWVRGDPTVAGDWQHHAGATQAVVNLAGESVANRRWTAAQKQRLLHSRVQSTRRVVEAIGAGRARILVNASAVGYYGPRGEEDLDESSSPGNDFLSALCRDWEAEARTAEEFGARVVMLRFAVVLSRRGGALPRMALPFKLFAGGPVGDPQKWFPWVHEDDAIGLASLALDGPLRGPVNVVGRPVRMQEFAKALGKALYRPAVLPFPEFALKLLMGEMAGAIVPGQKVHPKAAAAAGYRFRYDAVGPALAAAV